MKRPGTPRVQGGVQPSEDVKVDTTPQLPQAEVLQSEWILETQRLNPKSHQKRTHTLISIWRRYLGIMQLLLRKLDLHKMPMIKAWNSKLVNLT